MANQYETFRATIVQALLANCVAKSKDGASIAYNWSMDKAFQATGEACKMENVHRLPGDFKDIVRFEFNKLKDSVMSGGNWEHKRTRTGYAFTIDGIEATRSDSYRNSALPLSEQLDGARKLFSKVGNQLSTCPKDSKRYLALNKRAVRLTREIDFLTAEIERQARLSAEVNNNVQTTVEQSA